MERRVDAHVARTQFGQIMNRAVEHNERRHIRQHYIRVQIKRLRTFPTLKALGIARV